MLVLGLTLVSQKIILICLLNTQFLASPQLVMGTYIYNQIVC